MRVTSWFSATYAEGREKFLAASGAAGAALQSFRNPQAGPAGEMLYTDAAWLGPDDAKDVLFTCSGTHGVEGFCGSGIQVGSFRGGLFAGLPRGVAVLAVHAINPYGFAWVRRVTEDNVDLNRNFVDHGKPRPKNAAYDAIHAFLLPADWNGRARDQADRDLQQFIQEHGMAAFQAAVSGGQYDHADGLFYGGQAPTWSHNTILEIARRYCRGRRRVAFIDYHTGLGPSGVGELICTHPTNSAGHKRSAEWFGEVTSPWDASSVSAPVEGFIAGSLETILPETELTSIAIEYGTFPVSEVLGALRADNWLHLRGEPASPLGQQIKREIRRAFYPDTDEWKEQVWRRAEAVSRMALRRLGDG
ncbi:MAG TPA: M14 family metallopeptidase [Candidatus Sulfotelmatobacter sp.]|nr:M14 family metallopeptidase [Candidatus Sulfotelmatobacter sp.]